MPFHASSAPIETKHPNAQGGMVDYFLKIASVPGESMDSKHKGEIEIETWTFGEEQSGTFAYGSGGGAGKVSMKDFRFTKRVDKASPKLFEACASGEHIPEVILVARKAGKEQQEFYKVTLSDVLVSSYHTVGSGDSDVVPRDEITFNFAKIKIEYREQTEKGTLGGAIVGSWDVKTNKAAA